MKNFLILEEIKTIMVEMTIDCTLPTDMNDLDIHSINEQALERLKNNDQYQKVCMIEKLGDFISADGIEALEKLEAQEKIDGSVMADEVVDMWEPLEYKYTVNQLLEEIS